MPTKHHIRDRALLMAAALGLLMASAPAVAQERLPWLRDDRASERAPGYGDVDRDSLPPADQAPYSSAPRAGAPSYDSYGRDPGRGADAYRPPASSGGYGSAQTYGLDDAYRPPVRERYDTQPGPYRAETPRRWDEPRGRDDWRDERQSDRYRDRYASSDQPRHWEREPPPGDGTFSMREIVDTGHGFFGSISQGLASVIEYAFKTQGRPNGYILGEDVGGAFVAGLRYGEGTLYTRDAGTHRVYWQGPSIGYDAGAEGSRVMVLVYNLRDPADIYDRFGGVAGSAYVVGGVGITFQKRDDIVLAPIRAGLGLRLGANVGYLKYTRRPTWNPF